MVRVKPPSNHRALVWIKVSVFVTLVVAAYEITRFIRGQVVSGQLLEALRDDGTLTLPPIFCIVTALPHQTGQDYVALLLVVVGLNLGILKDEPLFR